MRASRTAPSLEDAAHRLSSGCWRLPARAASCNTTGCGSGPGRSDVNPCKHQGQKRFQGTACPAFELFCAAKHTDIGVSHSPTRRAVTPHSSMPPHQYQQCPQHAVSSPLCPAATLRDSRMLNEPLQCCIDSHSTAALSHTSPQTHLKLLQSSADAFIKLIAVHLRRHAVPTRLVMVLPHQHLQQHDRVSK